MQDNDRWYPDLSPKQMQFVSDRHRCILASGPRRTGKTIACLNRLVRWLWEFGGPGVIIGRSITDVFNCGTWTDLTEYVIPQWIAGDFGLKWVTTPRMEGATKRYFFEITNLNGGVSRCYLESLDNENEASRRFKNKRYSIVYMIELTNFKNRYTFDTLYETLRVIGKKPEEHCLIADTNPDFENGVDSWIYQLWYYFIKLDLDNLDEEEKTRLNLNELSEEEYNARIFSLKEIQRELFVYEFYLEDNPYISNQEKNEIKARWLSCGNKAIYEAYVLGKWSKASTSSYFSDVFKYDLHVVGNDPIGTEEPEILLPEDNCYELYTGWDIGTTDSAVVFVEKILFKDEKDNVVPAFKVLDEYVIIGEPHTISGIVEVVLEKMDYWERQVGRKIKWTHWSDKSAFEKFNNIANTYEAGEIYRESNGRILLQEAFKGPGHVQKRSELLKRLLFMERLFISKYKCPNVINMFLNIKPDKNMGGINRLDYHKDVFDALSYCLSMECYTEMHLNMTNINVGPEIKDRKIFTTVI